MKRGTESGGDVQGLVVCMGSQSGSWSGRPGGSANSAPGGVIQQDEIPAKHSRIEP
jgi:hypothetical protein